MDRPTAPSTRTRIRRLPERARYDADSLAAVLDACLSCTIAFAWAGTLHALPTLHWRNNRFLYIHGARASRMLQALTEDTCCVSVARVDGLVFARSAFHHSINYRSAVVYGRFEPVEDPEEKTRALRALLERLAPGRWETLRPMQDKERQATTVLRLALDEAAVKIRQGGPKDDADDLDWPVWAGVIPLSTVAGTPLTEPDSAVRDLPASQRAGMTGEG